MSDAKTLQERLLEITTGNVVQARGASGKKTYLDRFVEILLDEDGEPTKKMTRVEIIAQMSYDIAIEQREEAQAKDPSIADFDLDSAEDLAIFADLNKKCKAQVAAAVSDSQNGTALSFNEKYKETWTVVKDGKHVSLAPWVAPEVAENQEEVQETE